MSKVCAESCLKKLLIKNAYDTTTYISCFYFLTVWPFYSSLFCSDKGFFLMSVMKGYETLHMPYSGLDERFEADFADTCAERRSNNHFRLVQS